MQVAKDIPSAVRSLDGGSGDSVAPLSNMDAVCEKVGVLVRQNAVVVFTISCCCMCHVVKQLLFGLGVGPTVFELDRDASGGEIHAFLARLSGGGKRQQVVPAVFVGGKYLGGIETVMACHINGSLVPLLKNAGALWL
ncbi:Glutaredoxin-C9 [Orobanche gracilis]